MKYWSNNCTDPYTNIFFVFDQVPAQYTNIALESWGLASKHMHSDWLENHPYISIKLS